MRLVAPSSRAWRISEHHPQGLIVDLPKDIVYRPSCRRGYLVEYAKGAMTHL